jgi:glycosyltransferase involved in cell wall biosynthesis
LINRGIPEKKISISMNVPDHKVFKMHSDYKLDAKANNKFMLIYHGTLAKRLGIDLAIQAISKLVKMIPGLEFHIYGGGEDSDELIQLSKALRVEPFVHFHSTVQIRSLIPIIQKMHLGVVSNRKNIATELMLPVKMLEYVALSIPVVAPRLKTIQYYFEEDMVSYFEPDDVDSLTKTILELYSDKARRRTQAEKAKEFINKHGWEKQQMDFINLYRF